MEAYYEMKKFPPGEKVGEVGGYKLPLRTKFEPSWEMVTGAHQELGLDTKYADVQREVEKATAGLAPVRKRRRFGEFGPDQVGSG
ncbi:hypothetical protein ANO11243_007640 [Dothideomycetidae sp. 11243]|nr:hypothetical protein ANO11243_007640 [fungal sp. No.11243]